MSSQSQITFIDPGNVPGGLFWTIPIPKDSVEIDLPAGTAEYALDDLETLDFHDLAKDLEHGPSVPVTISFRVRWSGVKKRFQLKDAATGFRGDFIDTSATMDWIVTEEDRAFFSDKAKTSVSLSAVIGREANGVFFSQGDGGDNEHG